MTYSISPIYNVLFFFNCLVSIPSLLLIIFIFLRLHDILLFYTNSFTVITAECLKDFYIGYVRLLYM